MIRRLVAASLVVVAACGKDEPAPPPPTASAPSAAPTQPESAGAPKDDQLKPGAAGAQVAAAKAPEPAAPAPLPAARTTPAPELSPIAGTTLATFPPSIVAIGGTRSLTALVDAFGGAARQGGILPGEAIDLAVARVKATFGLDGAAWFAADKPIRFAVPDPKLWPEGFYLMLPLTPGTKLAAAQISGAVAKVEGHFAKLEREGRVFWLDLVDEALVVSSHVELHKKLGGFAKELAAWSPSDVLVLEGSVTNARTIFAQELARVNEMTAAMGEQMKKAGMQPEQLQAMESMVTGVFGLIAGLDKVSFALDLGGTFPRARLALTALPGSPLATTLGELEKRRATLVNLVPAEAWLTFAYDLDLPALGGGSDQLAAMLTRGEPAWTPEEVKALSAHLARLQEVMPGPAAMWVTTSNMFPLTLESVSSVSDAAAARTALLGVLDALFTKHWGAARAKLAEAAPAEALPGLAFPDFIRDTGRFAGAFGVKPSLPETPGADTLALDFDWARLGSGRIPAPLRSFVSGLMGPRIELSLAAADGRFAMSFGPDGARRALALTTVPATQPIADAWLERAARDAFAVVALRPTRFLRSLADMPQLVSRREALGALPDDPMLLDAKSAGGRLEVTLTVPLELSLALMKLR